ncbi:hypothetical protein ID866_7543 [Astraeus odoratus]|nr:hypothetical protein ID866_7543 [Astraeus odoratus]
MHGISTEFGSTISIVSDWMGMGDARAYVQNNENDPCPLVSSRTLMDIAAGVVYLHGHILGPIVHSDLKGLNVVVSNDRRALLTDFGYSALSQSSFSIPMASKWGASVPWMAPELLDENSMSTTASDVWAFGMTALVRILFACLRRGFSN